MDNRKGYIELEGLSDVLRRFDSVSEEVREAAMTGMEKGGMRIIADAQDNLRKNGSVVTGLLRASGRVQKIDDLTIDVGFFDTTNKYSGYAYYVEHGRKAGRMPPPAEFIQYARKKLRLTAAEAVSAGWAMAMKVAREGTQPHPFFRPAVEKNQGKILDYMMDELKK